MRRVRLVRPQRTPIFVGCEGQSEMGYAGWLRNLVRDRDLPLHLELSDLGRGAGDPYARVELAIDRLQRMEGNREPFAGRFLFLDTDQLAANVDRAERARRSARDNNLTIIWQNPTHEAFLLRHLPGCDTRRPPNARVAEAALIREWRDYRKPCSADQIDQRLSLDGAHRVAVRLPEFEALLRQIGLLNGE